MEGLAPPSFSPLFFSFPFSSMNSSASSSDASPSISSFNASHSTSTSPKSSPLPFPSLPSFPNTCTTTTATTTPSTTTTTTTSTTFADSYVFSSSGHFSCPSYPPSLVLLHLFESSPLEVLRCFAQQSRFYRRLQKCLIKSICLGELKDDDEAVMAMATVHDRSYYDYDDDEGKLQRLFRLSEDDNEENVRGGEDDENINKRGEGGGEEKGKKEEEEKWGEEGGRVVIIRDAEKEKGDNERGDRVKAVVSSNHSNNKIQSSPTAAVWSQTLYWRLRVPSLSSPFEEKEENENKNSNGRDRNESSRGKEKEEDNENTMNIITKGTTKLVEIPDFLFVVILGYSLTLKEIGCLSRVCRWWNALIENFRFFEKRKCGLSFSDDQWIYLFRNLRSDGKLKTTGRKLPGMSDELSTDEIRLRLSEKLCNEIFKGITFVGLCDLEEEMRSANSQNDATRVLRGIGERFRNVRIVEVMVEGLSSSSSSLNQHSNISSLDNDDGTDFHFPASRNSMNSGKCLRKQKLRNFAEKSGMTLLRCVNNLVMTEGIGKSLEKLSVGGPLEKFVCHHLFQPVDAIEEEGEEGKTEEEEEKGGGGERRRGRGRDEFSSPLCLSKKGEEEWKRMMTGEGGEGGRLENAVFINKKENEKKKGKKQILEKVEYLELHEVRENFSLNVTEMVCSIRHLYLLKNLKELNLSSVPSAFSFQSSHLTHHINIWKNLRRLRLHSVLLLDIPPPAVSSLESLESGERGVNNAEADMRIEMNRRKDLMLSSSTSSSSSSFSSPSVCSSIFLYSNVFENLECLEATSFVHKINGGMEKIASVTQTEILRSFLENFPSLRFLNVGMIFSMVMKKGGDWKLTKRNWRWEEREICESLVCLGFKDCRWSLQETKKGEKGKIKDDEKEKKELEKCNYGGMTPMSDMTKKTTFVRLHANKNEWISFER